MAEVPSTRDIQNFQHKPRHQPHAANANNIPSSTHTTHQQQPHINLNSNHHRSLIMDYNTVDEYSGEGIKRILKATKAFQSLPPAGPLWDLQKSYPEFSRAMKNCRTRILPIMKTLLEHAKISATDFKKLDLEEKFDFIVESNDDILERIATALDEASGLFKRTEILVVNQNKTANASGHGSRSIPEGNTSSSWNTKKVIDYRDSAPVIINNFNKRLRVEEHDEIIQAKASDETSLENRPIKKAIHRLRVTEKPQIHFKTPIDNSLAPFVPKLTEKPNSIKPLSILPEYNSKNEEFYGHPYNVELNRWEPDDVFMTTVIPQMPLPLDQQPFTFVATIEERDEMMKELREATELGIDLEHHSFRTFLGLTCTIQISTRANDYVIDALALREDLECLNEVFTKPKVMKIMHGSQSDIEWLQRDFGVYIVGLFDTHVAAKHLGLPVLSLQYLLQQYCGINVDKTYQLADWRIRPLPIDMVEYCRQDTHYLPYLYDVLKNQLIENGNQFKNLLTAVYDRSRLLCLRNYEKPLNNPQLALRKTRRQLNNRQLYAFTHLYKWRDGLAREKDESLGFILPNHMLLMISESLPKEMTGILSCCDPVPPMVQTHLGDLHRIILQARELPLHEEKIQLGTTGKRKKLKNWVVVLNSIHDVNLNDINHNVDKDDDHEDQNDEVDDVCNRDPVSKSSSRVRLNSKTCWPEPWDPNSVDISNIKIKSEPSTKIFGSRLSNMASQTKTTSSSAFERYQLSNEIIEMLKDPKKKEELNLEDPLVRVVYDTLVADSETRKLSDESLADSKQTKQITKLLPDSEFVPFNPMAKELSSFQPPSNKRAKKGKNKHEEWNDGEPYETSNRIAKDHVGAPVTNGNDEEDQEMYVENESGSENEASLLANLTSNSKKKSKHARFLERIKLKKLMKLKEKKKYELAALEQEQLHSGSKKNKKNRDGSDDIIEVIEVKKVKTSPPNRKGQQSSKLTPAKPGLNKRAMSNNKRNMPADDDDDDVICLDDDDNKRPFPKPRISPRQPQKSGGENSSKKRPPSPKRRKLENKFSTASKSRKMSRKSPSPPPKARRTVRKSRSPSPKPRRASRNSRSLSPKSRRTGRRNPSHSPILRKTARESHSPSPRPRKTARESSSPSPRPRKTFNKNRSPSPKPRKTFNKSRSPSPKPRKTFNKNRSPSPKPRKTFNKSRSPSPKPRKTTSRSPPPSPKSIKVSPPLPVDDIADVSSIPLPPPTPPAEPPVDPYAGFMQKGKVRAPQMYNHITPGLKKVAKTLNASSTTLNLTPNVTAPALNTEPPFVSPVVPVSSTILLNPNFPHQQGKGVGKFLNQFRRVEGKSVTFNK